jgi:hypothetical protein
MDPTSADALVTFEWKDYRAKDRDKAKVMTLAPQEAGPLAGDQLRFPRL